MIVGTAGHVNHGKTTLVEALTGVNCDRLEQERARGMTIELGFAPWTLPDGRKVSVIDVPGHARFARTMAAGAVGVQVVVLVIAADEGWMPQTHEHVAACRVLGVKHAVVAMTRTDRVEVPSMAVGLIREKLDRTCYASAAIVPVCAPLFEGIDDLAARVAAIEVDQEAERALPPFLAVDRAFTQHGFGTVVTGSLLRGALSVGDRLMVYPSRKSARVRTLHVHGESVERVEARTRIALNLADVSPEAVPRGSVLGAPEQVCVGRVVDAEIEWLAHNAKPLRRGRSLGWGSGPTRAQASIVCEPPIKSGKLGVGRLHLDRDVPLVGGQRFVLRGTADRRHGAVVGGGRVIDASPPDKRRSAVRLRLVASPTLGVLLDEAGARGVDPSDVGARLGSTPLPSGPRRFAASAIEEAAAELAQRAGAHVEAHPASEGLPIDSLAAGAIFDSALAHAIESGMLVRDGTVLRPAGIARPDSPHEEMASRALDAIAAEGLTGPRETELLPALGVSQADLGKALALLEQRDAIVRVQGICFSTAHAHPLRGDVARAVLDRGSLDFNFLKQHAGLSRKHAMALWVWLDREGVTQRKGDSRAAGPAARKHADGGRA